MDKSLVAFVLGVVNVQQLNVLAYLCGANLLLGLVAALAKGQFELAKLKDFWRRVAVVFGSYLSVAIAVKGFADFTPLVTAIWVALLAYLVAQIVGNLKDIGLPIPEGIAKFIEK